MKPLAVISDIHGNKWALEAVLADIGNQGISSMINLGDSLYGPLDPGGTAELLMEMNIPTVCGNQDRVLLQEVPAVSETLRYVKGELKEKHYSWIRTFRKQISLNGVLAFHASPVSDVDYLLWKILDGRLVRRTPEEVSSALGGTDNKTLVLCGHDHVQRVTVLQGGITVVNPGSIGLPAYEDDEPVQHEMVSGTPCARYSIVRYTPQGYSVDERVVEYSWVSAAETAEKNGRCDWAHWISTGSTRKEKTSLGVFD